jgi:hypothetical protein
METKNQRTMDITKIDNIIFDGIDHKDAPDYVDTFILSADYDGQTMTDEQLDEINGNAEFIHEQLINYLS